jgi:hypothetical protein
VLALLAVACFICWPYFRDPGYAGAADAVITEPGQPQEQEQQRRFAVTGDGSPARVVPGPVAYLHLHWSARNKTPATCQAQLALIVPSDWGIADWASHQEMIAGTVNGWRILVSKHSFLADARSLFVLPHSTSGEVAIAWSVPPHAQPQAALLRGYIVYACNGHASTSEIATVLIRWP